MSKRRKQKIIKESKKVLQEEDECESHIDICTDNFDEIVENLSEKSASSRINSLEKLNSLLTTELLEDELQSVTETLQYYFLNSLKKGGPKEIQLTCRCISLTVITLGVNANDFCLPFLPVLETLLPIDGTEIISSNIVSIIHVYSVISFVCNDDMMNTSSLKFLFNTILKFKKAPSDILAAALQSWAFLASKIPSDTLYELVKSYQIHSFIKYLSHDSVDVRTHAGQNIALIYEGINSSNNVNDEENVKDKEQHSSDDECMLIKEYNNQSDYIDSKDTDKSKNLFLKSKSTNGKTLVDHNSLIQLLTELSTDSDRKKNKKERAVQRHIFRSVLATVENTDYPSEKLKIISRPYIFKGWREILQLYSLRSFLLSGFQLHLEQNTFLHQILHIKDIENIKSLTHTSKDNDESDRKYTEEPKTAKMMMSKQSEKSRHLKRQSQRTKKTSFQSVDNFE